MAKKKNKKVKNTIKGNKLRTLNIYKTNKKADDTTKQKSDANISKSNDTTNSESTNNDKEYKEFVDRIITSVQDKIVSLSNKKIKKETIEQTIHDDLDNVFTKVIDLKNNKINHEFSKWTSDMIECNLELKKKCKMKVLDEDAVINLAFKVVTFEELKATTISNIFDKLKTKSEIKQKSNTDTNNSESTNNDKDYKKFVDYIITSIFRVVKLNHSDIDKATIKKVLGDSKLMDSYNEFVNLKYDDNNKEETLNLLFEIMRDNTNNSMKPARLNLSLNLEDAINLEFKIVFGIIKVRKLNSLIHGNYNFENVITNYSEDNIYNDSEDNISDDDSDNNANNYLELLSLLKSKASLILNNTYTIEIIEKFRKSESFNSLKETDRNKCIHSTLYWLFGSIKNSIKSGNKVDTFTADNRLLIEIYNHISKDKSNYDIMNWVVSFDNTVNNTITAALNKGFTGDDIWKMLLGLVERIKNSIIEKLDNKNLPIKFKFDDLTTLQNLVSNILLDKDYFNDDLSNKIKNVINNKISKYILVIDNSNMYPSIDTSRIYFSKDLYSDIIIKIIFDNFHNVITTTLTKKDENLKPIYDILYTKTA